MKKYSSYPAFTLVEILVAMSILSIIMVSVISVFIFSSQMSTQVNLNRVAQENIKNVLEDISEGVRKDGISGVRDFGEVSCPIFGTGTLNLNTGSTLCLTSAMYTLGSKNPTNGEFLPVSDPENYCTDIKNVCYIIKKDLLDVAAGWYPLTNSFLSFQKMDFLLSNPILSKLTLLLEAHPAVQKGLPIELLEKNMIRIQTSVSERLIKTN